MKATPKANLLLSDVARGPLGVPTLDDRKFSIGVFHDVTVWRIRVPLDAAFEAGPQSGSAT